MPDDALQRVSAAAEQLAESLGCTVQTTKTKEGWVASMEPPVDSEKHGEFSTVGEGATEAQALSRLIETAKKTHGV
ncbi:MAG TPA: hypothetical protein VGF95_14620 [Solirubrobacteraceae bacterium]|jgi:hypothetical protein